MSQIILIPRIKVQNANMQTGGFILGGAPLMAAAMFCHNLARQINTQDLGFILIHHDRQILGGHAYGRFTPAQRRGAVFIGKTDYSSKNKYALSLQPTASCHLEVSLIIEFERVRNEKRLADVVQRSRFAGGQIISFEDVQSCESTEQALQKVRNGFVVQDKKDLLQHYQQLYQVNRLQALVQLLAQKPDNQLPDLEGQKLEGQKLEGQKQEGQKLSWLSATSLGYALLEQPSETRTGVRQADGQDSSSLRSTPHAYAEPLIGLVQYQSLRDVSQVEDSEQLDSLYWRYGWPQPDIFLLQQQAHL